MSTPYSSMVPPMAAESSSINRADLQSLKLQVSSSQLYNRQLSSICQVNGLKSTGVKADLQHRIIELIHDTVITNDAARFHQIRHSVANAMGKRSTPQKPAFGRNSQFSTASSANAKSRGVSALNYHGYPSAAHHGQATNSLTLTFKPSPFYEIESAITGVQTCPPILQHRGSVHLILKLSEMPLLQRCIDDPTRRVLLFCATEGLGPHDIAFPHQSEIKINGADFKANLRGLKNKPGSTRPVDITKELRLKPNYTNSIEFTYALTQKEFYVVACLCKIKGPEELAKEISARRKIPKDSVIEELKEKASDPDIVATSQKLSLKCPLTYMRLEIPCRSINCAHVQCFDATSYLQLQEQGPQWLCPICNKHAQFEHLAVDEYVRDILDNTAKSLETVTIEPNGRWSTTSVEKQASHSGKTTSSDDEDDEVCVVSATGARLETPNFPTPAGTTPGSDPRSGSTAPRGPATTSGKRPITQVIDLTLDSDEEEEERPAKRQKQTEDDGSEYRSRVSESILGYLDEIS